MITLSTHRKPARAEQAMRAAIRAQKHWDRILVKAGLGAAEPPAEKVYRVEERGGKWIVLFDDPSL